MKHHDKPLLAWVLLPLLLALPAAAIADPASPADGPAAALAAFDEAMRKGDKAAVLALLTEDAVLAEGGRAESKAAYAGHHLLGDMAFSAAVENRVLNRREIPAGDNVMVWTESERKGQWKDKPVHLLSFETAILVKQADRWRIRHFHWSSGPAKRGH
ncbi:MAG: nuclear transport factor 2 family protein [Gammaproteobacteria bacterium]|nr:nuclear transport factor 2 family protein [Gammaproteobacteria bacterium]